MIVLEKIEEYIELIDGLDKLQPIFIGILRGTKDKVNVSGAIIVTAVGEYGLMYRYVHLEDIPVVKLVPDDFFKNISDDVKRAEEFSAYRARFDNFEQALFKERDKMVEVLKSRGFEHIYAGYTE